jgi:hypothetical protein
VEDPIKEPIIVGWAMVSKMRRRISCGKLIDLDFLVMRGAGVLVVIREVVVVDAITFLALETAELFGECGCGMVVDANVDEL